MEKPEPPPLALNAIAARSRSIIGLGFALIIILIGFLSLFGMLRLQQAYDATRGIIDNEQVAVEMLVRMQQAARDRALLLYRVISTEDAFERDELLLRHQALGAKFAEARDRLSRLPMDRSETTLLAQLRLTTDQARDLQQQIIGLVYGGDALAAQRLLIAQAIPTQDSLLTIINTLLDYEIAEARKLADHARDQRRDTNILLLGSAVLAVALSGLIALWLSRRMAALIGDLSASNQELHQSNQDLAALKLAMDFHNIVSIANVQGTITYANDKFCQISQYSREELIGQNHRLLKSGMHPDSLYEDMWTTIAGGQVWQGEVCNRNKGGKLYWVYTTIMPLLDEHGLPYQYISMRTDITQTKEAQQVLIRSRDELEALVQARTVELTEREEILRSITDSVQDAVVMIDHHGNVNYWNPAATQIFGYRTEEITGRNFHELTVPARYLEAHHAAFPKFAQTGDGALIGKMTEVQAQRKDGTEFPVELSIGSIKIKNEWHAIATIRDITLRKQAEAHLQQLATTDTLTGIFNRRRFNELLEADIARHQRYHSPLSLIFFDIDHFKQVNDTYGHQAGDQVLVQLTALVSGSIRTTDALARWGGEEFIILTSGCNLDCARQLAEKLRMTIERLSLPEVGLITCSFGVAEFREGDDQDALVKRVDQCLYQAKESGRNRVVSA